MTSECYKQQYGINYRLAHPFVNVIVCGYYKSRPGHEPHSTKQIERVVKIGLKNISKLLFLVGGPYLGQYFFRILLQSEYSGIYEHCPGAQSQSDQTITRKGFVQV